MKILRNNKKDSSAARQHKSGSTILDGKPLAEKEDVKDVLMELMQEHFRQIRHYETQRSTVSNLLVIIAAAILAFVTYDKTLTLFDLPLTILLLVLGLFGAAFCMKYYERSTLNSERFHRYQEKIDEVLFNSNLIHILREETDNIHTKEFPKMRNGRWSWVKVHRLWIVFHLIISLLGLILTILAICLPQVPPAAP